MARRHRRRRIPASTASTARARGSSCHITKLPLEILTQIVEYLFVRDEIPFKISQDSAADLASTARVSRLFYHLAMPLLWREAKMWPSTITPSPLLQYPGTSSERVLNYIQKLSISTDEEDELMDKAKCNRVWKYVSRCLRVLVAAGSIRRLRLRVRLYNPDEYTPELGKKFKAINSFVFRILRQVTKMSLDTLEFYPSGETIGLDDMMRIIERKINVLNVNTVPTEKWVDRLCNHQNLTRINVCWSVPLYLGIESRQLRPVISAKFWTAISQLENVTYVDTDDIPISPALNLQFPHIVFLRFSLWWLSAAREVLDSFISIFAQMPNLETLYFHSLAREFEQQTESINDLEIHDIECRNLRVVNIGLHFPKNLLATIAKYNPNLTSCSFGGPNIDDVDIRYLSRCQHLRRLTLESSTNITNSLAYLTNLQQLDVLKLHYSLAKYMSTQLLLDISFSCLNLKEIDVADFWGFKRPSVPRPFQDKPLAEIFAAAVELHPYIEPRFNDYEFFTLEGLSNYVIRLDRIRKDRDQFPPLGPK